MSARFLILANGTRVISGKFAVYMPRFAAVLADDVVFEAPGGLRGKARWPVASSTAVGSRPSRTLT